MKVTQDITLEIFEHGDSTFLYDRPSRKLIELLSFTI